MAANPTASSALAGRYASALLAIADERKEQDAVAADLDSLAAVIEGSDELRAVMSSPVVPAAAQAGAFAEILKKLKAGKSVSDFIGVVAENGRLAVLPQMIASYKAELAARRGEVTATVTSAHELSADQLAQLEAELKKTTGSAVKLEAKVDPSVLGGLIVKVGSRMMDASLKTKLTKLRTALTRAA